MDKILKQFGEDKIKDAVKNSNSFVEATSFLGLDSKNINTKKNVERSIKRLGLSTEHFESVKRLKDAKTRYTKEKLEILVSTCKNYKEILEELDLLPVTNNYDKLKTSLYKFKIDFSHLKHQKNVIISELWDKESLLFIVKNSNTQKEVLEKMKIRTAGGNYRTLQKYIKLYDLDTSHFTKSYDVMSNLMKNNTISLDKILIENSTYSRTSLKKRLYKEGLKDKKCELCGQDEMWKGKKMSLILDHKNGIHNDDRIENLRIVCPNCNATLDTHCGKNNSKRSKKLTQNGFDINDNVDFRKSLTDDNINAHISRRKVERPSFDVLKNEINAIGFEATGRKYNVSGNAIKKWLRTYEKYGV